MRDNFWFRLQIETTSICNSACVWCPYHTTKRKKTFMNMDLYKKIIDEAVLSADRFNEVILNGIGEPLLDPFFDERVRYARDRLPGVRITLFTNGSLMSPKRCDQLLEAGINDIVFSLNALDAEQRTRQMGLKDYDKVVANINYAIEKSKGKNVRISVHAVQSTTEFNTQEEIDEFHRRWGFLPGFYDGKWVDGDGYGCVKRDINLAHIEPKLGCRRALDQIYVKFDGKVTACCVDVYGQKIFGDLNKQTLQEVYNSDEWVQFRIDHVNDHADRWEVCRDCRERQ